MIGSRGVRASRKLKTLLSTLGVKSAAQYTTEESIDSLMEALESSYIGMDDIHESLNVYRNVLDPDKPT